LQKLFTSAHTHHASGAVEVEDRASIGVLVRDHEPLPRLVELEVTRCLTARVENSSQREHAGGVVDPVHGDWVVPTIGRDHEVALFPHKDLVNLYERWLAREQVLVRHTVGWTVTRPQVFISRGNASGIVDTVWMRVSVGLLFFSAATLASAVSALAAARTISSVASALYSNTATWELSSLTT
jgi:hypothetical protein